MSATPLFVVFDCTTFAQALININGPAGACVRAAQENEFRLFVSDYVLQEIRELPGKLPPRLGVTQERTDRFITDLGKYTQFLEGFPKVFSYDRDEDDAPYIDLAHSAGAEYLVSRDNDLLDLMRAETSVGRSFASQFPNLKVVRPPDFLRELERIKTPDHGGA